MKKLQNSVRNWLNNRSRELTDEEEYFQKTNWFTVFTFENRDQIKEETRKLTEVAPSSPGYVQYWRKATSALSKTLSDAEQQTYVDMAVEWNTKGVPKDVQMKQVRLHLPAFLWQVLAKMYRQFGIRMMMFLGYESDGEILQGIHDHNDSLDDGLALKKVCPNWDKEPIGSTWEKYLQSAFNTMKQASSPTAANPKKKFEVKKAKDGHWDLPVEDFLAASLEQQKWLVRDFMNLCWQEMVGRKGSAPFSKMTKDPCDFVDLDAGYLPDKPSLEIKDPSHMLKDNVECLLRHWKERQENQFLRPIFAFKGTSKQPQKMTERTSPNISQVTSYNVIAMPSKASRLTTMPAVSPPDDSPRSVAAVSPQSKACELSLNAKCTTKVRTGSVEDTLPGKLDWKYDDFHLPPEGHMWSVKHKSAFGGDLFGATGEVHGRAHLVTRALFAGMLICDTEMVAGGRTPLGGYPFIPPELKGKTIPNHYISGYILPWCKRLSEQLKESHAEGISCRPHQSPTDVKGKWHEARDFMLCLSSDKQYRQLVMALEQIDNSSSPHQDCACGVLLSDFTWDNLSHHAGDVPHQGWAMALKAISLVGLSDTSGERHGQWYIALHVAFVGMVLRDVAMSKSTSAMGAYPSVPSFVASTHITDSCIADAMQWCKALRHTIVKGLQHKPMAQK
ncbi:hypothetical protein PAXINDRAFT_15516 [Paxillus involutus ATCC 200175]|uniref:Uncharacterized protein n=1 Tax=Paxillus involutus ATCC 200175 TaxID=664439 RepID=A0A0C9SSY1_PAXIN|nr:hypothetical protein PAXINDRAFT_15516 [Paxillus involutus ATCC 200175]